MLDWWAIRIRRSSPLLAVSDDARAPPLGELTSDVALDRWVPIIPVEHGVDGARGALYGGIHNRVRLLRRRRRPNQARSGWGVDESAGRGPLRRRRGHIERHVGPWIKVALAWCRMGPKLGLRAVERHRHRGRAEIREGQEDERQAVERLWGGEGAGAMGW